MRPLALSPDGTRLFVVNTPDGRLEIFDVGPQGALTRVDSVPVGLEPVAVAARSDGEVWVVNHLSDSVSIIDVATSPARVVRTLLVGDEPRDIVFGGAKDEQGHFARAFITTARRGQSSTVAPDLTKAGTPRALVWVFDASLGDDLAAPLHVVELFGDTPRALAVSSDGATVYAAIFHSGNETTSVAEGAVCNGGSSTPACPLDGVQVAGGLPSGQVPGGLPAPNRNKQGILGPETGLIVKLNRDAGVWEDRLGRNWNNAVRFDLPDLDVFEIDALADPPAERRAVAHVGTVLFNMLVNPSNGKLYVTNTDARNEVRFEGPGTSASTVRGHLHEARLSIVDANGVTTRHLNKHLAALQDGYRTSPVPTQVRDASLAIPLGMALASDGTLYVAGFGSGTIGRYASAALEDDSFVPSAANQIAVGGGPSGVVFDEASQRLYTLTRFDNSVVVVDPQGGTVVARHALHNPEPSEVIDGRRFLYDAHLTSSNGEASCASCHVFADFDSLAWDLGNPDDVVRQNFNPTGPLGSQQDFHPLKGPMTTQTLRGMSHSGPMHWRGDRTGAQFKDDPAGLDEQLAFEAFNVAFEGLLGRDEGELPAADMTAFAKFVLHISLPPNPIRAIDNRLTAAQARGRNIFLTRPGTDGIASCHDCHTLEPQNGFFGTGGKTTFENEPQELKVPHLRNAYEKVGMFGMPDVSFVDLPAAHRQHQGPQVRGFGFLHDGSIATANDFLHASVFALLESERSDLEQFVYAFDTDLAPIVGQQVTVTTDVMSSTRVALLMARAATPFVMADQPKAFECDLVVKGVVAGLPRGFRYDPATASFASDRASDQPLSLSVLDSAAGGAPLTFTCAPPGDGVRLAIDRDEDGYLDRDEVDAGSDPADPHSTPQAEVCVGDCDADGAVTVDEIVTAVNITLGTRPVAECEGVDANSDGNVTVDELVQAIARALEGCAA